MAEAHLLLALWEGDLVGMCISGAWNPEKLLWNRLMANVIEWEEGVEDGNVPSLTVLQHLPYNSVKSQEA